MRPLVFSVRPLCQRAVWVAKYEALSKIASMVACAEKRLPVVKKSGCGALIDEQEATP